MNRTTYFVIATLIGYLCAAGLGFQLWGDPFVAIFQMRSQNNGLVPILSGVLTSLSIAFFIFGRKVASTKFWMNALAAPLGIFLPGAIVGCGLNYLINGLNAGSYEWFLKPLAWITYLGAVYSLILGIILFFTVFRPFVKK